MYGKKIFYYCGKIIGKDRDKESCKKITGLDEMRGCEKIQDILEDCFGVASYFKISKKQDENELNKNAVEFYHNNIRDCFYCEYIWMNLQRIYREIIDIRSGIVEKLISEFQSMFQYSDFLDADVINGDISIPIQFFQDKVYYYKEKNIEENF